MYECESAQRRKREREREKNRCEEGTEEATGPEYRTCIDLPQAGRRDVVLAKKLSYKRLLKEKEEEEEDVKEERL